MGCYDIFGHEIKCAGSGQDTEFRKGLPWPVPRFDLLGENVEYRLSGFTWTRNANLSDFR